MQHISVQYTHSLTGSDDGFVSAASSSTTFLLVNCKQTVKSAETTFDLNQNARHNINIGLKCAAVARSVLAS